MPSIEPFYVMVQRNALQLQPNGKLVLTFDLKGSKYQRQVIPQEIYDKSRLKFQAQDHCSIKMDATGSKIRSLLGRFPFELKKYLQKNQNTLKDNDIRMLMQEFNLELYILPSEQRKIIEILSRDVA